MPPIETAFLNDKAVLWSFAGQDTEGEIKVLSPVEIDVNFTLKQKLVGKGTSNTTVIDAMAYVDQDIEDNSILWIGTLEEWTANPVPTSTRPLMLVAGMTRIDDTKGRAARRTVNLQFYRKTLPTVAS